MAMQRTAIVVIVVALLAYLGLCGLLFTFQRSLIYFPTPLLPGDPAPAMTLFDQVRASH